MNFQYTVDPNSPEPIMLLNKQIGNDEDSIGIDGAQFQAELLELDRMNPKRIQVWINSPGGEVGQGYNIQSAILKSKTPVDTYCVGMAASIAGVIFQAGRNRIMSDYSFLMYHNAHGGDDKKLLTVMNDSINKMVQRSGKTEEEIKAMMNKTTYITADEALEYGMTDSIETSSEHNKKRMSYISNLDSKSKWKEANLILNNIFKIENKNNMSKVANKLGLADEANESSILAAITAMQNKMDETENKAKNDFSEMDNKMKDAENKLKESKDAYDKLKKEKDDMDEQMKNELKDAMKEKCKNMVTGFATIGKIKNESKVVDFYTELAMADGGYDIIKDQLESLPLNKQAPVMIVTSNDKQVSPYNMAAAMGTIANKTNLQK
jgi:ATP-dependent Clp endopeptidase proteolytic subunit ClpP